MKNIKITLMLLLLVSLTLFALTSCEVVDKVTGMIAGAGKQPEPEHTHSFSEATCVAPATCECGATDGEALGHSIVVDNGTAPTCTESGLSDGEHCDRCDYKVEQTVIDAKGHTYASYIVSASCTEKGYTFHTCRICGDTYYENEIEPAGHTYIPVVTEPTCTEAGYTTYTCYACDDSYVADEVAASGHSYEAVVTDPTCAEAGYTTYTCACGDTYTEEIAAIGHSYVDVVTTPATCTATGVMTPTCTCGATLDPVDIEMIPHVDLDHDITCDYEGCTKRILPEADSTISLFTANHMIIISLTNNYYVEGVVTSVEDARNGKFVITDEAGDSILIYLPVDENGLTHANWVSKVLVGDVVRVYGKPVNTSGLNTTEKAAIKSGVLTFITKHPHVFGEPTCTKPGYCECGQDGPVALGHADNDGDSLCDACGWNVNYGIENITTKYSDIKETDKVDTSVGIATFEGVDFNVIFEKGSASFNTNGSDHMRMNKGNKVTIQSLNGKKIVGLCIAASSSSYVDELELFLQAAGYEYTIDGVELIIYFEATECLVIENTSTKAQRIAGFKVIYDNPVVEAEPVTVTMANTITDTQTTYMTGGNDAELVGLDPTIFTVTANKGSVANNVVLYYKSTLNVPSQIRLSSATGTGHSITVSAAEGYEISSIKITFTTTANHRGYVVTGADGTTLYSVATDATFESVDAATAIVDVNGSAFTITNVFTSASKPVWIAAIEITYVEK